MRLAEMAQLLPDPSDYYRGVSPALPGAPTNVLLFARDRAITGSEQAYHHRHVLISCLEGRGTVIVDGQVHALAPEQGILIFPFQTHHYGTFAPGEVAWLFTTFEYGPEAPLAALRNSPHGLDGRALDLVESLLQSFLAERAGDAAAGDLPALRLAELLAGLVRRAERELAPGAEASAGTAVPTVAASPRHELLRRAVAYAHENIARRVTIADVAAHVCLSPSRLRAVFRRELGASLGDFLLRNRLNRACALLGQSEMNVSEVAAACGFESIYSFSRAFRRRKGVPPTRYRREVQQTAAGKPKILGGGSK